MRDHQEDAAQGQDFHDVIQFTRYLSRELPGIVRGMLEVRSGDGSQENSNADVSALLSLLPEAVNRSFQHYRSTLEPLPEQVTSRYSHVPGNSRAHQFQPLGVELSSMRQLCISNGSGQSSESSFDSAYASHQTPSIMGVAEGLPTSSLSPVSDGGLNSSGQDPMTASEVRPQGDYTLASQSLPSYQSPGNQDPDVSQPRASTTVNEGDSLQGHRYDGLNVALLPWYMEQEFISQNLIDWNP